MMFMGIKQEWTKQPIAWTCGLAMLLCGCKTDGQPPVNTTNHVNQQINDEVAVEIEQPSTTSLNRRAKVQDECPKLVQKRVDNTVISREDSILGNTCDYFIYPAIGDVVSVSVSDDRLKPYLDIPYYHDFANGNYQVVVGGRHVIRLEYDAFERKPEVMDYVIMVEVKPAGQ